MSNYFIRETNTVVSKWDGHIYMRDVKGTEKMELVEPLPCGDAWIPAGYRWNGASSGLMRSVPILNFPKWKHPIATCRHDWRCERAVTATDREIADKLFRRDVKKDGTSWEKLKGYAGVRIGAWWKQMLGGYS